MWWITGTSTQQVELEDAHYYDYSGTLDEFKAPFLRENAPVLQAGLRLVSFKANVDPCPFQVGLRKRGMEGNSCIAMTLPLPSQWM